MVVALITIIGLGVGVKLEHDKLRASTTPTPTKTSSSHPMPTPSATVGPTPTPTPTPSLSTCTTRECVELGSQILASLDESVHPCDDFYKFACNRFLKESIFPYGNGWVSNNERGGWIEETCP